MKNPSCTQTISTTLAFPKKGFSRDIYYVAEYPKFTHWNHQNQEPMLQMLQWTTNLLMLRKDSPNDQFWRTDKGELVKLVKVNSIEIGSNETDIGCSHNASSLKPKVTSRPASAFLSNQVSSARSLGQIMVPSSTHPDHAAVKPKNDFGLSPKRTGRFFWPFTNWFNNDYYDYPPPPPPPYYGPYGPYGPAPPPPPYWAGY